MAEDSDLGRELDTCLLLVIAHRLQAARHRLIELHAYPPDTGDGRDRWCEMTIITVVPTRSLLAGRVRAATTAPSLHNSQPWQFRIRQSQVDVYADPARRLRVLDPDGREQRINVGAAVFTLCLALRQASYRRTWSCSRRPTTPIW